jgi:APA family basic amino acid/polyamine antiporter
MRAALGDLGGTIIAAAIAISTLGFLSQGMLTAPRVYFAMAEDGLFFRRIASVHPRTRVPILAIMLQGVAAVIVTLSGKYEQILHYVISADFLFFGLTGLALIQIRKGDNSSARSTPLQRLFTVPGHPVTTFFFIAISWVIVVNTLYKFPLDSLIGFALILLGIPVYYFWKRHYEN